jgi:hypothetical protein
MFLLYNVWRGDRVVHRVFLEWPGTAKAEWFFGGDRFTLVLTPTTPFRFQAITIFE